MYIYICMYEIWQQTYIKLHERLSFGVPALIGLQAGGECGGLSDEISAEVSAARFRQRRTVYDGLV